MTKLRFDPSERVGSVEDLVDYLRAGEKPPDRWRVGTEHEKLGLLAEERSPVDYKGERGISALLTRIAEVGGWEPVQEAGNIIALLKDGASITLEPGGQLELSGAPLRTIHETCQELDAHLALVSEASEPLGIAWLGLGIHPIHSVEQMPQMPKERYRIMRRYLPTRSSRPLVMMFTTATVQANLDYADEADMVEKLRTSLAISPIVSSLFANSSIAEGRASGFVSSRQKAWEDMDPDRSGNLPIAFEPDFGYRRYVEWALDVPMFFIVRDGHYQAAHDRTFREFLVSGYSELRPNYADWDLHLTTLFPDVRLKRFIEVRGADAVGRNLTCALPALWKGLLYDAEARTAAWGLVETASQADRDAARADVARRGLGAEYGGRPIAELARTLVETARDGLRRIGHAGPAAPDETHFLDPLFELLDLGRSPGQTVLEHFEGDWQRSFARLIDYARY